MKFSGFKDDDSGIKKAILDPKNTRIAILSNEGSICVMDWVKMKTIWNLKFVSLCDFEASPFQSQFLVSLNSKNKLSAPTDSILVFSFCSEEPLFGFKATHGDPFVKADYF